MLQSLSLHSSSDPACPEEREETYTPQDMSFKLLLDLLQIYSHGTDSYLFILVFQRENDPASISISVP